MMSHVRSGKRPALLAIGDVQTYGYQHDAVSAALAVIERLGRQSRLYDTCIRTDTQLLTRQLVDVRYGMERLVHNLDDFDAVFLYTAGDPQMSVQQKADFLSFLRDEGKGLVGAHSAAATFYSWPEFGQVLGGYFDDHPWDTFEAPVIVEDPDFPAMRHLPRTFTISDEVYQVRAPYSRECVRVVARLDSARLESSNNTRVHRTDGDFPVAWAKMEGKGRVFYSSLGHHPDTWDDTRVQMMYFEAIKWAMGLTTADVSPRPLAMSIGVA